MRKFIYIICILFFHQSTAQTLFQNTYGSRTGGIYSVAADADAYYLLHNGKASVNSSELIKVDLNGQVRWTRNILINGVGANVQRIVYANNELLITAHAIGTGIGNMVAKLDTAGNVIWSGFISYGDINISSRIHPFNSGYLLTGTRDYIGSHSSYTFDITLAYIDAAGSLLWGKAFGDNNYEFSSTASVITTSGQIMVAGNHGLRTSNDYNPMLALFDTSGNLLWMKTFSDSASFLTHLKPTDLILLSDGNYAMCGYTSNTNFNNDAHLIKLDGNGNIIWARRPYQIGWQEYGKTLIEDSQGRIVMAGQYNLNSDYGDFISQWDQNGNLLNTFAIKGNLGSSQVLTPIYSSTGSDLVERPGSGYIYSMIYQQTPVDQYHVLASVDYSGGMNCPVLQNIYPFTVSNITWTPTNFSVLPGFDALSASALTVTDSLIADSSMNICFLVGIKESTGTSVSIHPNPSIDLVKIQSAASMDKIEVFDTQGRMICKHMVDGNTYYNLTTTSWIHGIYICRVFTSEGIINKRIIKQ